ncbi:MAG: RNA polymerase subunit sigma-70 [Gemmatimonadetes bacterium]|nr:RNA polymerase subunit sigma-70 [Gemmatimonadota bacterium]
MTTGDVAPLVDHLFRREAGRLVARLARRFGVARLDVVEDAVQDALVQACRTWPFRGIPADPAAWIATAATNRALDLLRTDARRDRLLGGDDGHPGDAHDPRIEAAALDAPLRDDAELGDDELGLLFACAHPALSADTAVILMLKTVGGFGVREIARGLLSEPAAIAQRLVRARRTLAEARVPVAIPTASEAAPRVAAVADALYLMFTEGHSAAESDAAIRRDLCHEALRLALAVADHPRLGAPALDALVAMMAFTAARLDTRLDDAGIPVLLAEQDRARWDRALIALALARVERSMAAEELSRWHVEAELAGYHALAPTFEAMPWAQVVDAYDRLLAIAPSPVVRVNRAVALGFAEGPAAALEALESADVEGRLARYPWLHAARAHAFERLGAADEAKASWHRARDLTTSEPHRRFIERRLAALG